MAKRKSSKKANLANIATAAAGGFIGGQVTNVLQNKVTFLASNPFYAPLATVLIGTSMGTMMKNKTARALGEGMAVVAATELLEKAVVKFMPPKQSTTVNGPKTRAGVNLVR